MFKRDLYIDQLHELSTYFPVLILVGARQVGKTTLAQNYAKSLGKEYLYLDMERPSDYEKMNNAEAFLTENADKTIVIDEVQVRPELFSLIRVLVDEDNRPCRFILIGSASTDIVKGISETLAGRSYQIEINPLSYIEINDEIPFEKHFFYGGFPKALLSPSAKMTNLWLNGFIKTYLERDLPMLGLSASPQTIGKLWKMVAWHNGNLTNYTAIGNALGLTYHTISKYLDFMEGAFLLMQMQPYIPNSTKKLIKAPKIYIRDNGVLHSLLEVRDYEQLQGHIALGASWETYVISQIKSQLTQEYELMFYRTHAGAEIDLIIALAGKAICTVEIKYGLTPKLSRGYYSALEDIKVEHNYVIIPKNEDYSIGSKSRVCGLRIFIEKYLPIVKTLSPA